MTATNLNDELFKNDNTTIKVETIGTNLKPEDIAAASEIEATIETSTGSVLVTKKLSDDEIKIASNERGTNSWLLFLVRGSIDLADVAAGTYKLRVVVTIDDNPITLQNPDGAIGTLKIKA